MLKGPTVQGYDLYRPEVNDDLQRYFDFYCKGIDNGWEAETPRIRLSLLGFEDSPAATILERAEKQYPPAGVEMQTLYLDARDRGLKVEAVAAEGEVFHESHHLTESSVSRHSVLVIQKLLTVIAGLCFPFRWRCGARRLSYVASLDVVRRA